MRRAAAVGSMLSLLLLLAGGCEKGPASISVEPKNALLTSKGQTLQLKVTVKDKAGQVLSGVPVVYKSLTPTMVRVDTLGKVSAVTSGSATVLVEAGKVSRQVEILVQIPKRIAIEPERPLMMLGVTRRFKGTVFDDRNKAMIAGKITWVSSDPEIFTVDSYGDVKTKKEGEATLTAKAAGISGSTKITVKHEELDEESGTLSQ